ncbi:hypothetical protein [Nostoc sp. C057]|nr:hypothetical protein [Nostoc sp. C057]
MKLEEEFRSKAGDVPPTVRIKPTRDNYEPRVYPSVGVARRRHR